MNAAQDKRIWLAGGAVVAVVIAAIGWLGVISPKVSSTKTVRDEAATSQEQNTALAAKVAKLKLQNDNVGTLTTSLRTALTALPFDSGLPAFTRQLSDQATANRIALTSIAVGAASPVSGGATTTTTTTTSPTTTTGTSPAAGALVAIPITLASTGTVANQLAFLNAIQVTGPRRALVSSTSLAEGSAAGSSTMTTQLTVFSAPLTAAAKAQLEKLLSGK